MGTIEPSAGAVTITQGDNTATVDDWSADGLATTLDSLLVRSGGYLYNGATWDRARANTTQVALASAARTATTASEVILTGNAIAVAAWIYIATAPGGETLNLQIQGRNDISGNFLNIANGSTMSGADERVHVIGAGDGVDPSNSFQGGFNTGMFQAIRIRVWHSSSGSWTYSVGVDLIAG